MRPNRPPCPCRAARLRAGGVKTLAGKQKGAQETAPPGAGDAPFLAFPVVCKPGQGVKQRREMRLASPGVIHQIIRLAPASGKPPAIRQNARPETVALQATAPARWPLIENPARQPLRPKVDAEIQKPSDHLVGLRTAVRRQRR